MKPLFYCCSIVNVCTDTDSNVHWLTKQTYIRTYERASYSYFLNDAIKFTKFYEIILMWMRATVYTVSPTAATAACVCVCVLTQKILCHSNMTKQR